MEYCISTSVLAAALLVTARQVSLGREMFLKVLFLGGAAEPVSAVSL